MNIIPEKTTSVPNYWCTWALQNYIYGQGLLKLDPKELEGAQGALKARNNFNQEVILGLNGWARELYPNIRKDLFIVLDDGWDVPIYEITSKFSQLNIVKQYFASFYLNNEKFPDFDGKPEERLKKINNEIKDLGWKGIGLWVAAQEAKKYRDLWDFRKKRYWKDRMLWSKYAGINYWKVDWGMKSSFNSFRKSLTELAKKIHPNLIIEHANPTNPFNNPFGDGRVKQNYVNNYLKKAKYAEVLRLYDISPQLSISSMLDRAGALLQALQKKKRRPLLNCEDEVYLAAGLGLTMGIMRYPYKNLRPNNDLDLSFIGPRKAKERIDEVIRAINWQRIAPPFVAGSGVVRISEEILFDSWHFNPGDYWDTSVFNKTIKQGAPAIVIRGNVKCVIEPYESNETEEKPFIVASCNPTGAVTIATLGRTSPKKGYFTPARKISMKLQSIPPYCGIFGNYRLLTLIFATEIDSDNLIIWGQDLAGEAAKDITANVKITNNSISLSGDLINKIGLEAAHKDDISEPGLVLKFESIKI